MSNPAVIGLDIAKNVFQVHGADIDGRCVLRRRLRRAEVIMFFARLPRALVGIEACPGGHHWARELRSLGHDVRLIPPQYVRPFVKTNKNDAADAEGICEAVVRPNMRFVPIKSVEQQAAMMLHRTRALLLRQRTQLINAVRGHLAEFGLIARRGARTTSHLASRSRTASSRASTAGCATSCSTRRCSGHCPTLVTCWRHGSAITTRSGRIPSSAG